MQSRQNVSDPGGLLLQVAAPPALHSAWRKVRANRGAAGIDAVSIHAFERNLALNLKELSRNLLDHSYEPMPARHVSVLKPDGRQREIAILTVRDRVAQRAVLDAIEPAFENEFLDCSFAFRPDRSVEMAIQHLIVARAQGLVWTVDADVENFFGAMDHEMLLAELRSLAPDQQVLGLIKQWLDAGALDGSRPTLDRIMRWRSSVAGMSLAARDAVDRLLDQFVCERLGVDPIQLDQPGGGENWGPEREPGSRHNTSRNPDLRRAAISRLLQDGVLLAVAERAALKGLLSLKMLGIGGAAIGLAAAAPFALKQLKQLNSPRGALQGAPLSPLLSNVYLHAFDVAMTAQRRRLVRYCDDFVILCRTEADAVGALRDAEAVLRQRRLRLNPDKTRIVSPLDPFEFLGHQFTPDGRVVAPPSLPEVVTKRMTEFASHYRSRASARIKSAGEQAKGVFARLRDAMRRQ